MKSRPLGRAGVSVSAIGLGGMPMSLSSRPSEAQSIAVIHAALSAGVTLIDTADVYCIDDDDIGHNERLIAKAIASWHGDRDQVLVATKGGLRRPKGAWVRDGHPAHIRAACELSLVALGVEAIDLYQLHAVDPNVPYAETLGELATLKAEGKVHMLGLSNVTVGQIREAQEHFDVVTVQNRCNPFDRRAWREGVIPYCEAQGITFLPWSPVGGSQGKGRVSTDATLSAIGRRHGVSPFRIALAWLLARSPVMVPIPGASRVESILDSAAAADFTLSPAAMKQLDAVFPID